MTARTACRVASNSINWENFREIVTVGCEKESTPPKRRKIEERQEGGSWITIFDRTLVFELEHPIENGDGIIGLGNVIKSHTILEEGEGRDGVVTVSTRLRKKVSLFDLHPENFEAVYQELGLLRGLLRTRGCHGHVRADGPMMTVTLVANHEQSLNFALEIRYSVNLLDSAVPLPPYLSQNSGVIALFNYILGEERRRIEAEDYAVTPEYLYEVISRAKHLEVPEKIDIPELESELLRYQRKTVRWCLRKEGKDLDPSGQIVDLDPEIRDFLVSPPTGWRETTFRGVAYWANPYTANLCCEESLRLYVRDSRSRNEYGSQGLLSEEMGLGKSIEMISLILMNKRLIEIPDITWNDDSESRANNTTSDDDGILQDSTFDEAPRLCSQEVATTSETKLADDIDERLLTFDPYLEQVVVRAKTTLIICPNSIRSQWVEEIQRHAPSLNVFVYTGMTSKQPTPTVRQLGSYDVVITTYHAISRELHFAFFNPGARSMRNERSREDMNRLKSPLVRIQFWRVILDEVQMVNSGVSKAAQVARIVPRVHAWGVTGTPVKKSMADLQGIFIFLRMDPFTNSLVWNQVLASPADFEVIMSTIAIRHTATMVKDDIAIPSQTRYLLSLPFNAVEQNNYQHLFASFLDACGLNDDGSLRNPMESIENGKLSSWFLRLRQACGHARIGQSNRRALGGGPLRTVGDVLNAMLEQTHATLLIDLRRFYLLGIEKGQIREAQRDPVGALELWEEASKGVEPILESVRRELDEFKQEKARREQEIEEQRKMREEEWRENTEDNMGDNALNDGELIDDFDDDETDDNLTTLNIRLKSWLELMHRCYFFIATSHYQIGQIMDEDKKAMEERCGAAEPNPAIKEDPDATPPFSFVALGPTANGNKHESTPDTLPYSSILGNEPSTPNAKSKENLGTAKRRFSVTESPQEARNSSVRIKYDEQKRKVHSEEEMLYYQKAELLRRELLQEPIKKVEGLASTLRKRVKLQKFSVIEDATLEEGKLRLGLESRYLLNAINDLGVALNQQADVIDGWREELIKLLAADLVDQDVDPDGEEYANSLDAQEYAFSYIEVLRQVLADRSLAVAGNADSVMEKANQYSKKSEFEIKLEKTREEIKPLKVERGQDPYEMSLRGLLSRAKRGVTFGERAAVENQLMGQIGRKLSKIYTAQNRGLRELTKEVGFFSDLFNARVAYYKRLQELSDNVESLEFDAADAPRMVKKRTREEKALTASINQQRARQRFLQTLSGDQAKPEEDRICVICQSSFTIGCLTVCGHQFCKDCLQEWWKVNRSCPLCKRRIGVDEVYNFTYRASDIDETMDEPVDNQIGVHDESLSNGIFAAAPRGIVNQVNRMQLTARYSSKIDFIIRHLLWLRSKDPKTQVVIFSQWSEMLDLIGVALSIHRIHYATVQERMDEFKKDKDIACFLLHAKSESAGLTLVNATHVYICEPLVNTALEVQAMSRIHRIGQKHRTAVWMFSIADTVEEGIYRLATRRRIDYLKSQSGHEENAITEEDIDISNTHELAQSLGSMVEKGGEVVRTDDIWKVLFYRNDRSSSTPAK